MELNSGNPKENEKRKYRFLGQDIIETESGYFGRYRFEEKDGVQGDFVTTEGMDTGLIGSVCLLRGINTPDKKDCNHDRPSFDW